jgi:hypothetical protein
MSALPPIADIAESDWHVWAKNGLMQCSKVASYLIALAAVADI